ncbi:MAG: septum formation initiator family protein [Clostridia bacterium]|nr:septum formation initiator family protein [Clostridia bacterium]
MASAETRTTTAAENPLCQRLMARFDGRGVAANEDTRVQTASFTRVKKASPAVSRAKSIANPFEETAQFVRGDVRVKSKATAETVRFTKVKAGTKAEAAMRRTAAYEVQTPFASGAYAKAYERAAAIRARAYDGSEARESVRRESERKEAAKGPKVFSGEWFARIKAVLLGKDEDEVVVKKAPVSASLIIGVILFAVVVMMIIFSFAQISEFKREISTLDREREELVAEIDQLSLEIDLKNDIRTIEQIATEEIGMVKSNRVESKYISVAQGERVELPAAANDVAEESGVLANLLSAAGSNWEKIMEYID